MNKGAQSNNTSGVTGVHWHGGAGKWTAEVAMNGRRVYLGLFETIEGAAEARRVAAKNLQGEYASARTVKG